MNPSDLEAYLHEHIPLSKAMGVKVERVSADHVVLSAPLEPNINHRGTLFGGSAASVAVLAAWSVVHLGLTEANLPNRLVIQRSSMEYLTPVTGDFTAEAQLDEADWATFLGMLKRRGRARIDVRAALNCDGEVAATMDGAFVALRDPPG